MSVSTYLILAGMRLFILGSTAILASMILLTTVHELSEKYITSSFCRGSWIYGRRCVFAFDECIVRSLFPARTVDLFRISGLKIGTV